jgi:spore maturation protein CgeB
VTRARQTIVFLGLTLSSSWGNGHATTYRALLRGLAQRGHRVTFLERDMPWYAANRDMPAPDFCELVLYADPAELAGRYASTLAQADAVIVGSFVPDGVSVIKEVLVQARGVVGFYDIDTPVTLAALERSGCAYLSAELIPAFDVYFSFTGGPTLTRLERELGAGLALPLYCMVDPERYRPTGETPEWDLGYLGTYSADRQPAIERLLVEPARRLPEKRFVVAGPQYPDTIEWPANVDRIEHVAPVDHASFYSRLRYALNVTRADMLTAGWSPSVRLFEATACGVPVISDRWPGLDGFFPEGEAILVADGSDEVVAALAAPEDGTARQMAARARRITLSTHTGRHRATELEQGLLRAGRELAPVGIMKSAGADMRTSV